MFSAIDALWKKAVDFHGHACPGLAIGCRMVAEAVSYLDIIRPAEDEEYVCLTETDACCVDAVQALLGCTLGKGNLFLKLRGKAAMTFYRREGNKGCRVVWTGVGNETISREEKIRLILSPEGGTLYRIEPVGPVSLPEALLSNSIPCAKCRERTSEAMLRPYKGSLYCLDCWPDYSRILG